MICALTICIIKTVTTYRSYIMLDSIIQSLHYNILMHDEDYKIISIFSRKTDIEKKIKIPTEPRA